MGFTSSWTTPKGGHGSRCGRKNERLEVGSRWNCTRREDATAGNIPLGRIQPKPWHKSLSSPKSTIIPQWNTQRLQQKSRFDFWGINTHPDFPSSDSTLTLSFPFLKPYIHIYFYIAHKKPQGCHFPQIPIQHNYMGFPSLIQLFPMLCCLGIWEFSAGFPRILLLHSLPFSQPRQHMENIPISSTFLFAAHNGAPRREKSRKGFCSAHGMTGCSSLPTTNSFVFYSHSWTNSAPGTK